MFMLLVSIAIFIGLLLVLKKTRIGLIVQAALTHPHMVGHLGTTSAHLHAGVRRRHRLAAVAGVIAGPALVTQSNMAGLLARSCSCRRGRRARLAAGAFVASLLIACCRLRGLDERLAVRRLRTAQPGLCLDLARRHLGVTIAQIAPIMPYMLMVLVLIFRRWACWDARHMSEITASRPPLPPREKLRFYASWLAAALVFAAAEIFTSGGSMTTFSLIGISIIFSLSYNILLGQTGMLSFGHAVYYGLAASW